MTKIAELKDKGAVVAWSPFIGEYADVIALGSKVRFFKCCYFCGWLVMGVVCVSNLLLLQRFYWGLELNACV